MTTTHDRCPSAVDLERTYWMTRVPGEVGDREAAFHAHITTCTECARQWDEIAALADAGRQLEPAPTAWDRREDIRTTILSRVEAAKPRPTIAWPTRWLAPLAFAAAALVAWLAWPSTSAPPPTAAAVYRGQVLDHATARHLVLSAMPDEIVRLVDGTVTVTIAQLVPGERFRVITGDGEVESNGAAFDVTARGDRLVSVRAIYGAVKLLAAGTPVTLRAGETWRASTELAIAPPSVPVVLAPTRDAVLAPTPEPRVVAIDRSSGARGPSPTRPEPTGASDVANDDGADSDATDAGAVPIVTPPPRRSMGQQAFDDGWEALRTGEFTAASKAFERAIAQTSDPSTLEDAAFWRGVALARAGELGTAAQVFEAFLIAYPASPRGGEVAVMLGWLLFERGDTASALRRFELGARDPSARVRDSAAAGQRAVAVRAKS